MVLTELCTRLYNHDVIGISNVQNGTQVMLNDISNAASYYCNNIQVFNYMVPVIVLMISLNISYGVNDV